MKLSLAKGDQCDMRWEMLYTYLGSVIDTIQPGEHVRELSEETMLDS